MLQKSNWNSVKETVLNIAESENSYRIGKNFDLPDIDKFSDNGFSQLGIKLHFPAPFIAKLFTDGHTDLAAQIVGTKKDDFFMKYDDMDMPLLFREFKDTDGVSRIHGVLSDKYSVFDDKEVINIIENNSYLMNAEEVWKDITPDHFHCRFVSPEKLHINGDPSPLSMCVFVDNSMVGRSMLTIRFGLYRWACTNGVISGLKSFNIVRERHMGVDKSWEDIVATSLEDTGYYEEMLLDIVKDMSVKHSAIYGMSEEDAVRYIKDKLSTSSKKAAEIIDFYQNTYGGHSRWDLCNAITDVAHSIENIDNRLFFEQRAMMIA